MRLTKKPTWIACVAAAAFALAAAPALGGVVGAADELRRVRGYGPPLEVEVWVDKGEGGVYAPGEEVGVRFRTNRDCFLVIYDIDTEGFLHLLFPETPFDDGYVRGGRIYRLPAPRSGYRLIAEGPEGVEYVAAIASAYPLARRLPWYLRDEGDAGWYRGYRDLEATVSEVGAVRGDPFVAMQDIAYEILPEEIPESDYFTDYTYFHVGRTYSHPRYLCYDCHGHVSWFDPYVDACAVFEIRVDLGWRFVTRPTLFYVGPRFWYVRRAGCPPVYLGLPDCWCSLYPRYLYREYFYTGLYAVGVTYERRGYDYVPPRYRGKPYVWKRKGTDPLPPRSHYGKGRGRGDGRYERRASGREVGRPREGKSPKRYRPGEIKRPKELVKPRTVAARGPSGADWKGKAAAPGRKPKYYRSRGSYKRGGAMGAPGAPDDVRRGGRSVEESGWMGLVRRLTGWGEGQTKGFVRSGGKGFARSRYNREATGEGARLGKSKGATPKRLKVATKVFSRRGSGKVEAQRPKHTVKKSRSKGSSTEARKSKTSRKSRSRRSR